MPINQMKNVRFLPPTDQEWREKVEESLKGKKYESLLKNTYENIVLKPLYSKEDATNGTGYPGSSNYRRGIHALGHHSNSWKIVQKVRYQTIEQLRDSLNEAFERGQTAISFELKKSLLDQTEDFERLLNEFSSRAALAIQSDGQQKPFLALVNNHTATGFVAEDPIALLAKIGSLPFELEEYFSNWAETIKNADVKLPNLKTVMVDLTPYHNGGANAVQELAIALATGVNFIEELRAHGIEPDKLFKKIIFKFQIGANFFMELAKLRAARVLWDKIGEAYGVLSENRGMNIFAETSNFTKTLNDPHVNILRAGNEAFAAVLGGVQYLQVHAYNELEGHTPLAERLARNSQLILKEESFLQNIVDPAGGSWYIESLTNELVTKAWEYFLTIEDQGGLLKVLESNWLQSEIAAILEKRQQDSFSRKQSIVGTNVYANLQEAHRVLVKEDAVYEVGVHKIQPIRPQRLSKNYELLRQRANQLKSNQIGLICLGELKEYKARADFMTGFLAAAGLQGVRSQGDASSFIKDTQFNHYVICSSNEKYAETGLQILKKLKQEFLHVTFYLAGIPENQSEWLEAGIREFVHIKTNCHQFNNSIITELEGVNEHDE
ncbi:methylmalonyl-CoA mutase family protein [Pseudoneobacillus sp. C159]